MRQWPPRLHLVHGECSLTSPNLSRDSLVSVEKFFLWLQEGYIGTGFDLRKRKIWDFFNQSNDVSLEVTTVSPSPNNLDQYSGRFDWIIGNHSDELTPWMPLLAR